MPDSSRHLPANRLIPMHFDSTAPLGLALQRDQRGAALALIVEVGGVKQAIFLLPLENDRGAPFSSWALADEQPQALVGLSWGDYAVTVDPLTYRQYGRDEVGCITIRDGKVTLGYLPERSPRVGRAVLCDALTDGQSGSATFSGWQLIWRESNGDRVVLFGHPPVPGQLFTRSSIASPVQR